MLLPLAYLRLLSEWWQASYQLNRKWLHRFYQCSLQNLLFKSTLSSFHLSSPFTGSLIPKKAATLLSYDQCYRECCRFASAVLLATHHTALLCSILDWLPILVSQSCCFGLRLSVRSCLLLESACLKLELTLRESCYWVKWRSFTTNSSDPRQIKSRWWWCRPKQCWRRRQQWSKANTTQKKPIKSKEQGL